MLELCHALVERGHELDVVAPDPGRGTPPTWPGLTVRWVRYALPRRSQRLAYRAGIPDNLRRNPALLLQTGPLAAALGGAIARLRSQWDAVISHWVLPSGFVAAALRGGRPHVAVAHSADVWLLRHLPGGRALLRFVNESNTAVTAPSPRLVGELRQIAGPDVDLEPTLLPLGPDRIESPDPRQVSRLKSLVPDRSGKPTMVIAVLARLVPVKGVRVLLEALAQSSLTGVVALVAGNGPERGSLESEARRFSLPVHFLGEIDAKRRAALLALADVLVVPSISLRNGRSEGAPIAAVEGLAAGLPIIASKVGGLSWSVGDAGLLIEPGSPRELADAVVRLRDDLELRRELGANARRRASCFGWSRAAARLEEMLTDGAFRSR